MADSLKLEPTGLQFKIPQVDFVGSRVQAQAMSELSANLDSMSNYFFKIAEQRAKVEGAEYGVDHAPTSQQIIDATIDGEQIDLNVDKYSVFGQSARSAFLTATGDQIEYLMRRDMTSIITQFDKGLKDTELSQKEKEAFTPDNLRTALMEVVAGYSSTLDEMSPAIAKKLRASMGITAHGAFNTYNDKWTTDQFNQSKSDFYTNVAIENESFLSELSGLLDNPLLYDMIQAKKIERLKKLSTFNPTQSEIKAMADGFDAEIKTVAETILSNELLKEDNPYFTINQLLVKNSQYVSPQLKSAVNLLETYSDGMTKYDLVKKLKEDYRKDEKDKINADENKIKADKLYADKTITSAYINWFDGDTDKADEIMENLITDNNTAFRQGYTDAIEEWVKFKDAEKTKADVDEDNDDVVFRLSAKGALITHKEVMEAYNRDEITITTAQAFFKDIEQYQDRDFKSAITKIASHYGHDQTVVTIDRSGKERLGFKLFNKLKTIMLKARSDAILRGEPDKYEYISLDEKKSAQFNNANDLAQYLIENEEGPLKEKILETDKNNMVFILNDIGKRANIDTLKESSLSKNSLTKDHIQTGIDTLTLYLQQRKDNNVSSELSKLKIIYDDIAIIEQDLEALIKLKSDM